MGPQLKKNIKEEEDQKQHFTGFVRHLATLHLAGQSDFQVRGLSQQCFNKRFLKLGSDNLESRSSEGSKFQIRTVLLMKDQLKNSSAVFGSLEACYVWTLDGSCWPGWF